MSSLLLLLSGCEPLLPPKIINELSIIEGAGYNLKDDNKIQSYFLFPVYKGSKEPASFNTIEGTGLSSKDSREDANRKTRYQLVSGQIRIILFSKEISEIGISSILESYNRDPAIGRISQLAVVDGDTKEILNKKFKEIDNTALYLEDILKQNMDSELIPKTDFNTFMYQYYQQGYDPYLPIVKVEREEVDISSIGVFKDDKLITQVSKDKTFIFHILVEKQKQKRGFYRMTLDNGDNLVIQNIHATPRYDVTIQNGEPVFNVLIKVKANILEYSSHKKNSQPSNLPKISREIEEQLKKDGLNLIQQFQENNVDPLGFGSIYEAHFRNFNEQKWKEHYPNAKINLKVKLTVVQTGISE